MDKVVITWQELENVAPIQIEGQSLCAFIMQSLVAFSFNGILLGSYNIISKKYNWQTKKHTNKRKPCRLFLNKFVAGNVRIIENGRLVQMEQWHIKMF